MPRPGDSKSITVGNLGIVLEVETLFDLRSATEMAIVLERLDPDLGFVHVADLPAEALGDPLEGVLVAVTGETVSTFTDPGTHIIRSYVDGVYGDPAEFHVHRAPVRAG